MSLILDSTLRDGAYAFNNAMPYPYVEHIASYLADIVDFIEVGSALSYGNLTNKSLKQDKHRLDLVNQRKRGSKSAVFIQPRYWKQLSCPHADDLFSSKPDLVRIGIDPENPEACTSSLICILQDAGISYAINLMKAYRFSMRDFEEICVTMGRDAEFIYVVDSAGCMSSDDILMYAKTALRSSRAKVGLHIHNNLGNADAISRIGLDVGFAIDSTLMGKGRDGGNADTVRQVLIRAVEAGTSFCEIDKISQHLLHATSLLWGVESLNHLRSILLGVSGMHSAELQNNVLEASLCLPEYEKMIVRAWS